MRAAPFATEADCGEAPGARSEFANAFNNLCLHTFVTSLPPATHACWARPFDAPPTEDPLVSRDIILAAEAAEATATAQGGGGAACCVAGCCA